jgi:peptide/nickel transport system substrate-binding protein
MLRRISALLCALLCLCAACRERPGPAVASSAPRERTESAPPLGFLDESRVIPIAEGGILRRRLVGEPTTLNAVLQSSAPEAQVLEYVQRNLFDFDARMNLVPGLAEGMVGSADGRDYIVTLRPEARWEDGEPVTAADAVFTIRQVADPEVSSPVFKPLFEDLESVEQLDDHRFRVRFRSAYAFRPMAFVLPVVPQHRFRRPGAAAFAKSPENRSPLSDGPYRVAAWKAQQTVELERNPRYWGKPGHFDRILFRILPDDTTAYRLLVRGELDEDQIDAGSKERAAADPAFADCCRLVEFYNLDYNYVALNNRSPFFADARVRRAMTMLLDRGSIVRHLYRGSARIISGPWAPDSIAYDPSVAPLPFDPAAAARLLDEAGWTDHDGDGVSDRAGRPFEFDLLVSAGSTIGREIDEMLASELDRVGVRAHVRTLEWAAFVERIDAGAFEAASLAWSAVDPNPDPYYYWHSSQCAPKGLNNGCYRNSEADRLMEETRRQMDPARRRDGLHRLHRLFRDEAPAIFVVNASQKFAFQRRVRGLVTSPLGLWSIWPGPLQWWAAADGVPTPAGGGGRPGA